MKTLLSASVIAIVASAATAQDAGQTSIALGLSNFGTNIEGAYRIDDTYRVRGAFMGGFGIEYEEIDEDEGTEVNGDFDLGGFAILGDYYPMQGGWRVSGGLFFSNTELNASGTVDLDVAGEEEVTVSAKFANEIAPMITTGYDLAFGSGWAFNSEIGVIFNGGLDIDYTASNAAAQDELDSDPDVQDAQDAGEDIVALPYLGFSVSYQF